MYTYAMGFYSAVNKMKTRKYAGKWIELQTLQWERSPEPEGQMTHVLSYLRFLGPHV